MVDVDRQEIEPGVPFPEPSLDNPFVTDDTEETLSSLTGHESTRTDPVPPALDDEGTVPELEWAATSMPEPSMRQVDTERVDFAEDAEETLMGGPGARALTPDDPAAARRWPSTDPTEDVYHHDRDQALEVASLVSGGAVEFGSYLLLGKVGEGGMADVRLAYERTPTGLRACVVKRIAAAYRSHESFRAMFQEEATLSGLFVHRNIVRQLGSGELDGVPFIALEFVDGLNLKHLDALASPSRIPLSVALHIAREVALALAYAAGLTGPAGTPLAMVHRDVSPQNVLIARDGSVKLTDFGIARFEGRQFESAIGPPKGKLRYMAPEQIRVGPVDARVDLYALGVVLTELASGQPLMPSGPLVEDDIEGLVRARCASVDGLPPDLVHLLVRLTQPDPAQRPATAAEVAVNLAEVRSRVQPPIELSDYVADQIFARLPPLDQRGLADLMTRSGTDEQEVERESRSALLASASVPAVREQSVLEVSSHPTTVGVLIEEILATPAHRPSTHIAATFANDDRMSALLRDETYLRDVHSYLRGDISGAMQGLLEASDRDDSASDRTIKDVEAPPAPPAVHPVQRGESSAIRAQVRRIPVRRTSQARPQQPLLRVLAAVTVIAVILFGIWLARR